MIEVVQGLPTRRIEPVEPRSELPERIADDPPGGGVELRRLLAVASLTPAQAALLVADAIDQLELSRSKGRGPIRGHAMAVSDSGRLTIDCTASVAPRPDPDDAMASLVRSIATNCRGTALADRLNESIAGNADSAELTRRIRSAVATEFDPSEEPRMRRQLAELVSATSGHIRTDSPVVAEPSVAQSQPSPAAGSLAPRGWFPPAGNPWHRKRRRPSRRRVVLGVLAILILIGALSIAPRAYSELRRSWDTVLHPVNPSAQNQISPVSPPPEPAVPQDASAPGKVATQPGPVPISAPGSAGPITRVTATFANGECTAGQVCDVRVDVDFDPAANVGPVTWTLNMYDRCTGEVRTTNAITLLAQPGWQQVYGISTAPLPHGTALAVAAITSSPAMVASAPLFVPAENGTC